MNVLKKKSNRWKNLNLSELKQKTDLQLKTTGIKTIIHTTAKQFIVISNWTNNYNVCTSAKPVLRGFQKISCKTTGLWTVTFQVISNQSVGMVA